MRPTILDTVLCRNLIMYSLKTDSDISWEMNMEKRFGFSKWVWVQV